MYSTLPQAYADRAKALIHGRTRAELLYAALEVRMGVEARLQSYVQASSQVSSALKRGWEIHKLFKGLEGTFSNSNQVVELEVSALGNDSDSALMHFIPVRKRLRDCVVRFGNALHYTRDSHSSEEWWKVLEESVVAAVRDLEVCSKATLLGVPLQNSSSTQVQLKFEFRKDDPRIAVVQRFAVSGQGLSFRVSYIPTEEYYANAA
ncbi:hypothetical protein [Xanthomonas arboricola]|uniref:hypothetical protein n=1 Tax=Xanthomonas arboricola TaxID=56448 RepID=UPI0011B0DA29|nr:hypothetical protein [Xanthomonas arboricola]